MEVVKMPRLGVTMEEAVITDWLKDEGDKVEVGEELFEIESDKLTTTIEAQDAGILGRILVEVGTKVRIGEVVAIIIDEGEEVDYDQLDLGKFNDDNEADKEQPGDRKEEKADISKSKAARVEPKARKYAKDKGLDLASVEGSGPGGVITLKDVQAAAGGEDSLQPKVKGKMALDSILKAMKKNISRSWQEIPQFTQILEVDAESILKAKDKYSVSLNALMIKAISDVVKDNRMVNSSLAGDEVVIYEDINVGIAVARKNGLIVPVVKNTESKNWEVIDEEINKIVKKDHLDPKDLSGGTITFSNLGRYGIRKGVSLINYPQSCLVFMGAIYKKADVDENDNVIIKNVFELSITFDHRYITGVVAAEFSRDLKNKLEQLVPGH